MRAARHPSRPRTGTGPGLGAATASNDSRSSAGVFRAHSGENASSRGNAIRGGTHRPVLYPSGHSHRCPGGSPAPEARCTAGGTGSGGPVRAYRHQQGGAVPFVFHQRLSGIPRKRRRGLHAGRHLLAQRLHRKRLAISGAALPQLRTAVQCRARAGRRFPAKPRHLQTNGAAGTAGSRERHELLHPLPPAPDPAPAGCRSRRALHQTGA